MNGHSEDSRRQGGRSMAAAVSPLLPLAVLMKCGFQLAATRMCGSAVLSRLVPVEAFVLERSLWARSKRWGAG